MCLVNAVPARLNLIEGTVGYIRKAAAANVSSRYIDIIASPCDELDFLSFSSPNVATYESLINAVSSGNTGWSGECATASNRL